MVRILTALTFVFGIGSGSVAKATPQSWLCGGEKPAPWGTEAPFPWKSIEGVWRADDLEGIHYRFEIIHETARGTKYLRVQIVHRTEGIIGTGIGTARRTDRIVRARVRGTNLLGESTDNFILVRTYNITDEDTGIIEARTFLTVRTLDDDPERDVHYFIRKVAQHRKK